MISCSTCHVKRRLSLFLALHSYAYWHVHSNQFRVPLRKPLHDKDEEKEIYSMERTEAEAEVAPCTNDMAPMNASIEQTQPDGSAASKELSDRKVPLQGHEEISRSKTALIMLALCMAVFLAALDMTIITTALPTIAAHFNTSGTGYLWIGSAYLIANAATVPSWGKMSDIFGRKPVLLIANIIFLVGSLICALAASIEMLIVGRVFQGVGGGGLMSLVNICIGDLFSERLVEHSLINRFEVFN